MQRHAFPWWAASLLVLSGCSNDNSAGPPIHLNVGDILPDCSPFERLNGSEYLLFKGDGHVEWGKARKPGEEAFLSDNVEKNKGGYRIDEATKLVSVSIAGTTSTFRYVDMDDRSVNCMLISGPLTAADITKSWFGDYLPDTDPPDP